MAPIICRNRPELNWVVGLGQFTLEGSDRTANTVSPITPFSMSRSDDFLSPVGVDPGPYGIRILDSELKTEDSY